MGEKGSRDFHFNVNVRTNTGSIARLANSEESFFRAMEIQERKREKIEEEQKRLEAEKKAEEQAAPEITPEPVENDEGGQLLKLPALRIRRKHRSPKMKLLVLRRQPLRLL